MPYSLNRSTSATNVSNTASGYSTPAPSNSIHSTGQQHGYSDKLVSKQRLALLVGTLSGDKDVTVDESVEEIIQDLVADYVSNATRTACLLAKHRHSDHLEASDFKTAVKRQPHP